MIQAGREKAGLRRSEQAGNCTASNTVALERRGRDSRVEGRGQGENWRKTVGGLN